MRLHTILELEYYEHDTKEHTSNHKKNIQLNFSELLLEPLGQISPEVPKDQRRVKIL